MNPSSSSNLSTNSSQSNQSQSNAASPPFLSALKTANSTGEAPQFADKLLASHQALLAQYAQQFYLNGGGPSSVNGNPMMPPQFLQSAMAAMAAANATNPSAHQFLHSSTNNSSNSNTSAQTNATLTDAEKDRERYLSSLYHQQNQQGNSGFHPSTAAFNGPLHTSFGQRGPNHDISLNGFSSSQAMLAAHHHHQLQQKQHQNEMRRHQNSSSSRSPSPTSSQQSGNAGCDEGDEDDEDCDDSQSINAANGEWTYEEQFKQVSTLS